MTSAFGKAILFGEHAVVYGYPALAGAIDCRVDAAFAAQAQTGAMRLRVPAWNLDIDTTGGHPVAEAVRAVLSGLSRERHDGHGPDNQPGNQPSNQPDLSIDDRDIAIDTALPAAAGLGSSAALAVALTRLLSTVTHEHRPPLAASDIERVANRAECCFHANPSGVDVALATRGGIGIFVRGRGLRPIDASPIHLAVGNSNQQRRTADMVGRVADARAERPALTNQLLDTLGRNTEDGRAALERGDLEALGALMTRTHHTLAALGVSTAVLDALVADAIDAGALGAKLTGAGGGGVVIAATRDHAEATRVVRTWRDRGFVGFTCRVGVRT